MKKIILAFVAIFSISAYVHAQQTHFGIKAGLNVASLSVDGGEDYDSKVGLHLGGLAHIHVSQHFAVQPELVFSMQGGESDNDDFKFKLNYINVPVMLQYMTNDGFRLQTGPQFGFLVGAETKFGDVEVDVKDELNGFDFAWSFGAGYLFPGGVGIDARYNLGLTNIEEDDNVVETRNRVFQVGLFYQFMHNNGRSSKRR
jgi:hypothetical protein